jgi:hypothetical protein
MEFEKFGKTYWHKNPRNIYTVYPSLCTVQMSVSRFQEKEKRGEMITKNDNIK